MEGSAWLCNHDASLDICVSQLYNDTFFLVLFKFVCVLECLNRSVQSYTCKSMNIMRINLYTSFASGPLIQNSMGSFLVLKLKTKWRLFSNVHQRLKTGICTRGISRLTWKTWVGHTYAHFWQVHMRNFIRN